MERIYVPSGLPDEFAGIPVAGRHVRVPVFFTSLADLAVAVGFFDVQAWMNACPPITKNGGG